MVGLKEIEKVILNEVVNRYIQSEQPIGSLELKEQMTADLSSATIRNYFRRLVQGGFLTQIHSSSGRIPTFLALQAFWQEVLDCKNCCEIDPIKVKETAKRYDIYALIHIREPNRLLEVNKTKRGTIIVEFDDGLAAVDGSVAVERLLCEFTGYDISDLLMIAFSNHIDSLAVALWQIESRRVARFNVQTLIDTAAQMPIGFDDLYDGRIMIGLNAGIYFESAPQYESMLLAQQARVSGKNALLVAYGAPSRDYRGFINNIRKEAA